MFATPNPTAQLYALSATSHGSGAATITAGQGKPEETIKFSANTIGAVDAFWGATSEDAKEWLKTFKDVARANGWEEENCLLRFKMCLRDFAKR